MPITTRNRRKAVIRTVGAGTTAIALALAGTALADTNDDPEWTITDPPVIDAEAVQYDAIHASGDDDVWAVGFTTTSDGYHTFAEHWDGKEWTNTEAAPGTGYSAVSGTADTGIWAVGWDANGGITSQWDGTKWNPVDTPQPDGDTPGLNDVTTLAADDTWAVGCTGLEDGNLAGTSQHWDGTKWTLVDTPAPDGATSTCLQSIETGPDGDLWALGRALDGKQGTVYSLRWDGGAWQVVALPEIDMPDSEAGSLVVPAGDSAYAMYAVGHAFDGYIGNSTGSAQAPSARATAPKNVDPHPLMFGWDGEKWNRLETPDMVGYLLGGGSDADGRIYAAGGDVATGKSLLLAYDGDTVSTVTAPAPDGNLTAATLAPSGRFWVAGNGPSDAGAPLGYAAYTG